MKSANLPSKVANYSLLALLNLYYCLSIEKFFPLQVNNQIFDWKKFHDENKEEFAYSHFKKMNLWF